MESANSALYSSWLPYILIIFTSISLLCISVVLIATKTLSRDYSPTKTIRMLFLALLIQTIGFCLGNISYFLYRKKDFIINLNYCTIEGALKIVGIQLCGFFSLNIDSILYTSVFYKNTQNRITQKINWINFIEIFYSTIITLLAIFFNKIEQVSPFSYMNCFTNPTYDIIVQLPFIICYLFNIYVSFTIIYYYRRYCYEKEQQGSVVILIVYPFAYFFVLFPEIIVLICHGLEGKAINILLALSYIMLASKGLIFSLAFGYSIIQYAWQIRRSESSESFLLEAINSPRNDKEDFSI